MMWQEAVVEVGSRRVMVRRTISLSQRRLVGISTILNSPNPNDIE